MGLDVPFLPLIGIALLVTLNRDVEGRFVAFVLSCLAQVRVILVITLVLCIRV